jgi:hypothetical protein
MGQFSAVLRKYFVKFLGFRTALIEMDNRFASGNRYVRDFVTGTTREKILILTHFQFGLRASFQLFIYTQVHFFLGS